MNIYTTNLCCERLEIGSCDLNLFGLGRNIKQLFFNFFESSTECICFLPPDIAIGAGGLNFDSGAGEIEGSVTNDSPPLRRFFKVVLSWRLAAEMRLATRHILRCNAASIVKI